MDIFESLANLETNQDIHCGRLMVLLAAFSGEDGKGEIEGLTKLVKLDFFLRYPVMLERALAIRKRSIKAADVQDYERNSVESKMVRYRYGPWDHRYWQFLAVLQGKGLIQIRRQGIGRVFGLTANGLRVAQTLTDSSEYAVIAKRANVLRDSLNLTATGLMNFVYATFPEIASLKMNEKIES